MIRAWVHAVVAVLTVATAARAQTPLTLSAAQSEARAHAPDAAELMARLRGATVIAEDAGRAQRHDPALSITGRPGFVLGEPDEYGVDVGISWTLDVSGSWRSRERSAAADRDRMKADLENGLRALDEAAAIALANLAFSQRTVRRLERVGALHGLAADAAKRKLDVGEGNQLDVDAADLDFAAARASAAQAQGDLASARIRLARLLGRARSDDLVAEDPTESGAGPSDMELTLLVQRDPRVNAAEAEIRAADYELETYERMVWPKPTLGLGYGFRKRAIPPGSFRGPAASGMSAAWNDSDLGFTLTLPIPVLDRQTQPRTRAEARRWSAMARIESVRADVRSELETYAQTLGAATQTLAALAQTPTIIDRDFDLLQRAVRAGALDSVSRAQSVRRLEEAGRRYDAAIFDTRAGRARWVRRTGGRL